MLIKKRICKAARAIFLMFLSTTASCALLALIAFLFSNGSFAVLEWAMFKSVNALSSFGNPVGRLICWFWFFGSSYLSPSQVCCFFFFWKMTVNDIF